MLYDATPNESLNWSLEYVGHERQPVLVIDDVLRDADSMVRYACEQAEFSPAPSAYPGLHAATPPAYVSAIGSFLADLISNTFHVRFETAEVLTSFFGLVTLDPDELDPRQQLPHVDSENPAQIALLHYFCDGEHGGTAFYRHRGTGFESVDQQRAEAVHQLVREMANDPRLPRGYIGSDNPFFEQTHHISARFNRLIIYRSNVFHCGQISQLQNLLADPRKGRLTVNTFVRFDPR